MVQTQDAEKHACLKVHSMKLYNGHCSMRMAPGCVMRIEHRRTAVDDRKKGVFGRCLSNEGVIDSTFGTTLGK